jgi:hypothetical protein
MARIAQHRDVQVSRPGPVAAHPEAVEAAADERERLGRRPREVGQRAQVGQRFREHDRRLTVELAGLPRERLQEGPRVVRPPWW